MVRPLEEVLLNFWNSAFLSMARPGLITGSNHPEVSEIYLRAYYDVIRGVYGAPLGSPPEFLMYPMGDRDNLDAALLEHEHFIARVFDNELVTFWGPDENAPVGVETQDTDRLWLCREGKMEWGRLYARPLRKEVPIERLALQCTRKALNGQALPCGPTPQYQVESSRVRLITAAEYKTLEVAERWVGLTAVAVRQRNMSLMAVAARACSDRRVWTWYALALVTECPPYLDRMEGMLHNRSRWSTLDILQSLDPDNGAVDLLRAVCYLKAGLDGPATQHLRQAVHKGPDFYSRDLFASLLETANFLGWSTQQARSMALGHSALLLFSCKILGEGLAQSEARPWLRRLALAELEQPLMVQQLIALGLLKRVAPRNQAGHRLRERIRLNSDFIRSVQPEQLSQERWDRYYREVQELSENEAIENLRSEGVVPQGHPDSWVENYLRVC